MNAAVRGQFDTIRELAFGGIGAGYAPIGTPLAHNVRELTVQNYTDVYLYLSEDGVNDNIKLAPSGGGRIYDLMGNKSGYSQSFYIPAGTQLYARAAAANPASGSVVVECIYGKGE